jgi:asparagine synthase (glutamine-hydrolysing)
MGGIAAAVNKEGNDAAAAVIQMLQQLKHRGKGEFHIATPTSTARSRSLGELETQGIVANTAIGFTPAPNTREKQQPIQEENYALVFNGHLFPQPLKTSTNEEVASYVKPDPEKGAANIIRKLEGSYAFAIVLLDKIIAGRDMFGTAPFYYGENQTFCAVTSERKALWTLEIKNAHSFPPGNLAMMNAKGFNFKPVAVVTQPRQKTVSIKQATKRLQTLLLKSTRDRVSDIDKVAVAFSGGLDSTVVAVLAEKCVSKVNLVTVGLENQPELLVAEKAAECLRLPLHLQTYTVADVERALERVLWLIEEPDVMKVGVAIPFFWTAEAASKKGCKVLLAGQGADELFGGYHRYLSDFRLGGAQALQKSIFHDVALSYETNFQRDEPVCAIHGIDLRLPYVDREVVHFALSLPTNMKIDSADDSLRKRVLRQVARNLGIPDFVVNRPKKAVQYATGVDKALKELAHRKGLTKQSYVKQVFMKVYPNWKADA